MFFGGRSPEHDVSVVTGLQILSAIDTNKYHPFPVYIGLTGEWRIDAPGSDLLRHRKNYIPDVEMLAKTIVVTLDVKPGPKARLIPVKSGLFSKPKPIEFDVALPCFHGLYGEDGNIQGLFELAGVPYGGMRTMASSVLMDKVATKRILISSGVPVLPFAAIKRPDQGFMIEEGALKNMMGEVTFPCIVKPAHLGSSIGVAKAHNLEEVRACLPAIFQMDDCAILEPFVENLVEYNVAITKAFGSIRTSAIERPKATEELLDFKQKYLSGGSDKSGNKLGSKTAVRASEGMLSLTRELNPKLPAEMEKNIRTWAHMMFEAVDGTGAPRIDFVCDGKTGQLWLNEVNPWPGSIGYFLWEAAEQSELFTDLMSALIEEAIAEHRKRSLPKDPVPADARLFQKRG